MTMCVVRWSASLRKHATTHLSPHARYEVVDPMKRLVHASLKCAGVRPLKVSLTSKSARRCWGQIPEVLVHMEQY